MTPFANVNIPTGPGFDFFTFDFVLDQVPVQYDRAVPEAERDFARHFQNIGLLNLNYNVRLVAVPEPGSAALLLGALALGPKRRRLLRF